MSHKSRAEFYGHEVQRTLLAWYACRLNPDYRKDWEANKDMVEWLRTEFNKLPPEDGASPGPYLNHAVKHWLGNIGLKWGFKDGRLLADPDMHIPNMSPSDFKDCQENCFDKLIKRYKIDKPTPEIRKHYEFWTKSTDDKKIANEMLNDYFKVVFSGLTPLYWMVDGLNGGVRLNDLLKDCRKDTNSCFIRQLILRQRCPYGIEGYGYVQQIDPNTGFHTNEEARNAWKQTPLGKFDTEARARDELVYWIGFGLTRQRTRDNILALIKGEERIHKSKDNPYWDKPLNKSGIVKHISSNNQLVISIDIHSSKKGMRSELDDILDDHIKYSAVEEFRNWNLWKGLGIYERAIVKGHGIKRVLLEECGDEAMTDHKDMRRTAERNMKVKVVEDTFKRARKFVLSEGFRKLVPSQKILGLTWNDLSPKERPPLKGGPYEQY